MKTREQTNGNRATWFVVRTDTNARGFLLVERTLEWKNFIPENFLEINRYFALTSYCNTIGQSNNVFYILGFSKRRCFDLFIHWLIKHIMNTYRNHFSRSYENHSKSSVWTEWKYRPVPYERTVWSNFSARRKFVRCTCEHNINQE